MEDLVAEMKSMTAMMVSTMESIKSTVEDSHSLIKELVAWKPQDGGAMQEVPAKCSTFCLCPDTGGVEVVASFLQSSIMSTTVLVPAGVSISPSMEQIITLKLGAATPTTCLTEVLANDISLRSAKLNQSTEVGRHIELACHHQMATQSMH
jgi:hypothetical protein